MHFLSGFSPNLSPLEDQSGAPCPGTSTECSIFTGVLYEIIRVLREVFDYPDEILCDWCWLLLTGSEFVVPRVTIHAIPEDPDDNKFLACAVESRVDYLVSGDHDLRRLGECASIAILRKHEFLRLLEKRSEESRKAEGQDDA